MPTPHRVVDEVADGVANGVSSVIRGIGGALKGAGGTIMSGLDKPFEAVTHKEGPHRLVDRALNGGVDAAVNAPTEGAIKTLQIAGEGICNALDQPVEQLGIPPDLKLPSVGSFNLPKIGR